MDALSNSTTPCPDEDTSCHSSTVAEDHVAMDVKDSLPIAESDLVDPVAVHNQSTAAALPIIPLDDSENYSGNQTYLGEDSTGTNSLSHVDDLDTQDGTDANVVPNLASAEANETAATPAGEQQECSQSDIHLDTPIVKATSSAVDVEIGEFDTFESVDDDHVMDEAGDDARLQSDLLFDMDVEFEHPRNYFMTARDDPPVDHAVAGEPAKTKYPVPHLSCRPEQARVPTIMDTETKKKLLEKQLQAQNQRNRMAPVTEMLNSEPPRTIIEEKDELDAAFERFSRERAKYQKKRKAGENSVSDDIEFKRLENEHKRLIRDREELQQREVDELEGEIDLNAAEEDDDLMFVPQGSRSPSPSSGVDSSADAGYDPFAADAADDEEETRPPPQRKQTKAAEDSNDKATATNKQGKKRKSGADHESSPKQKKKVTSETKESTRKSGKKKARKSKRKMKEERQAKNVTNIESMFSTDVFKDIETNTARPQQPTFSSKKTGEALKQLIASLPQEERNEASWDKAQVAKAAKVFGKDRCQADGQGGWLITGMKSSLTHYQMIGAAFMRDREKAQDAPFGGVLADAMGLGKTVMCLSVVVNGKAQKKDGRKTTLVVAPSSLLHQWMAEADTHVETSALPRILRYHGGAKLQARDIPTELSTYDMILTTYNEIQRSQPKFNPPDELTTIEEKKEWWAKHQEENLGPLHRVKFHRIILDEAQAIKNPSSRTSIGCRTLDATYRWCVTGTPVQNGLIEFYPIFRFLRVPHTGSKKLFRKNYLQESNPACIERLHCMLRMFMIRRSHGDTLFNAKLLDLPSPNKVDMPCHFSAFERRIYEVVRRRFIDRINLMVEKGELRQNYSNVLVMLLRLRQLVAHILLVHDSCVDLLEPSDFEELRQITRETVPAHAQEAAVIKHLRLMLQNPASLDHIETGSQFSETTSETQSETTAGGSFGLKNSYGDYLEDLQKESSAKAIVYADCPKCKKAPVNPHVTSCGHVYCFDCLLQITHETMQRKELQNQCVTCGEVYSGAKTYSEIFADKQRENEENGKKRQKLTTTTKATKQKKDANNAADVGKQSKAKKSRRSDPRKIIDTWIDGKGNMLPSAKTLAVKAQLLNWFEQDQRGKVIIYTQFLSVIHILSKMCEMEGWGCITLYGGQSIDQRHKVITQFKEDASISVLISSLKTGGTGLNLVMANKVINFDLWWNSSVEDQAFFRSYRRGQTQSTFMTRLIVQDSVDTQIIKLQQKKEKEIGAILSPEKRQFKSKATIDELVNLFGGCDDAESSNTGFIIAAEPISKSSKNKGKSCQASVMQMMEDDNEDTDIYEYI